MTETEKPQIKADFLSAMFIKDILNCKEIFVKLGEQCLTSIG